MLGPKHSTKVADEKLTFQIPLQLKIQMHVIQELLYVKNQTVLISSCQQINLSAVLCYTFLAMKMQNLLVQASTVSFKEISRPCWLDFTLRTRCDVYLSDIWLINQVYIWHQILVSWKSAFLYSFLPASKDCGNKKGEV